MSGCACRAGSAGKHCWCNDDESLPYQPHSETSKAAAERHAPQAATGRQLVLRAIWKAGKRGMTDKELQVATGLDGNTQRPRRIELVQRGLVRDSGMQRDRCTVWIALAEGEQVEM